MTEHPIPHQEPTPFLSFQAAKTLHTAHGPQQLNIRFTLGQGRLLAIYGPSGAGKTTLLRILAGLTEPAAGYIKVNGETWLDTSRHINLPTRRRSIGFVFQDFALFPHLTVRQQLEFALPKKADTAIITELLSLMELQPLQHLRPALLSGGQQQRVAIARAIARQPRLLLLDEPLSALDDDMRYKLQEYLLTLHRRFGLTTLLVSHYLPEIIRLSNEVMVIEKGKIDRMGPATELFFGQPTDQMPFQAVGEIIAITGNAPNIMITVLCAGALINIPASSTQLKAGQKVLITSNDFNPGIRPLR